MQPGGYAAESPREHQRNMLVQVLSESVATLFILHNLRLADSSPISNAPQVTLSEWSEQLVALIDNIRGILSFGVRPKRLKKLLELKKNLLKKKNDEPVIEHYSFWPFIQEITPPSTIQQITFWAQHDEFFKTDEGKEVAWIYIALRDASIAQYFATIRGNFALADQYYDEVGLMLEPAKVESMEYLLADLSKFEFSLDIFKFPRRTVKKDLIDMAEVNLAINSMISKIKQTSKEILEKHTNNMGAEENEDQGTFPEASLPDQPVSMSVKMKKKKLKSVDGDSKTLQISSSKSKSLMMSSSSKMSLDPEITKPLLMSSGIYERPLFTSFAESETRCNNIDIMSDSNGKLIAAAAESAVSAPLTPIKYYTFSDASFAALPESKSYSSFRVISDAKSVMHEITDPPNKSPSLDTLRSCVKEPLGKSSSHDGLKASNDAGLSVDSLFTKITDRSNEETINPQAVKLTREPMKLDVEKAPSASVLAILDEEVNANASVKNLDLKSSLRNFPMDRHSTSVVDNNIQRTEPKPEPVSPLKVEESSVSQTMTPIHPNDISLFESKPKSGARSSSFSFVNSAIGAMHRVASQVYNIPQQLLFGKTDTDISGPDENFHDFLPSPNLAIFKADELELTICPIKGLAAQKFRCPGCQRSIGIGIFSEARLCDISGYYFCTACHMHDMTISPARVVLNWEFTPVRVSSPTLKHLLSVCAMPLIDINEINPYLIQWIDELKHVKTIRSELLILREFIITCKLKGRDQLLKLLWPRDYLYENSTMYSFKDLIEIHNGTLSPFLSSVAKQFQEHIYNCELCRLKGSYCEYCKSSEIIYAFEFTKTIQCSNCHLLSHRDCYRGPENCPRCKREQQRKLTKQSHSY